MLLKISQLHSLGKLDKIIFHSIDISLYQVSVELDGSEYYVTENNGDFLRAFNILDLQKRMRGFEREKMVLRQSSAYDEMIGMSPDSAANSNTLEVEISDNYLS